MPEKKPAAHDTPAAPTTADQAPTQQMAPTQQKETAQHISWADFERVELRVGTIVAVDDFPEARKPAYRLRIDFGPDVGTRRSSAQITDLYSPDDLLGRQIIGVVNFPPKQIGPFMSEALVTGIYRDDGAVVLAVPEQSVANGARLA